MVEVAADLVLEAAGSGTSSIVVSDEDAPEDELPVATELAKWDA